MPPHLSSMLPSCDVTLAGLHNDACGSSGQQASGCNVDDLRDREGPHVHGVTLKTEQRAAPTMASNACSGWEDATPHSPFVQEFTKCKASDWWSKISTAVLRSRTSFGAFLNFSIRLTRSSASLGPPAPTLFPVPVRPGLYNRLLSQEAQKNPLRAHGTCYDYGP